MAMLEGDREGGEVSPQGKEGWRFRLLPVLKGYPSARSEKVCAARHEAQKAAGGHNPAGGDGLAEMTCGATVAVYPQPVRSNARPFRDLGHSIGKTPEGL
jgi:hypothetical protein